MVNGLHFTTQVVQKESNFHEGELEGFNLNTIKMEVRQCKQNGPMEKNVEVGNIGMIVGL